MYVTWDESLSVGVAELDSDHKKLLAILDDFSTACYAGQGSQDLHDILARLIENAKHHFDKEEALMDRHGYPMLAEHKKEHLKLIEQMERLERSLRAEAADAAAFPLSVSNDTMKFLNNWLTDHIKADDLSYKPHLNSMGVR